MSRRFSDRQLSAVRNHIPIRHVIENLLNIPSGTVQGVFRFRCPLCAGRDTAIKSDTNLSRCFHCGRNFNTIDLCMLVRHTDFVESVRFLIENERLPFVRESGPTKVRPPEPEREALKKPVAINDILAKLIGDGFEDGLKGESPKTSLKESPSRDDIAELDHIVHVLSQIIERLKNNTHQK